MEHPSMSDLSVSLQNALRAAASRTSEFRKYRAFGGAQVIEEEYLDGENAYAASGVGGGDVWIASPLTVTRLRFDAWIRRLENI